MHSVFFWKDWPAHYRTLWLTLSGLFILSLLFLWIGYFQDAHGIIDWQKIQEQKIVETTVHQFRLGPFELNIPAESYVIFEFLQGSEIHHNILASYVFLTVLVIAGMVLLSVITTLPRFWYYLGMALFILFVAALRLEVVVLFGVHGYLVPAIILFLFVALSFYFKSFRSSADFAVRILSFLLLAAVCGVVIYSSSSIRFPMLHLAVTAYLPALILCVLFIVMVAHEILVSFVYIASQGSKSLRHFLIISTIYLVNVFITCLHEIGVIDWQFLYLNLYLLLCTSALLGLWGFKLREPLYESILPFRPSGALFYLALGAICMITIGQLLANANDAALKIIRDVIIFSHAGYGLIFLTYIFSNFMVMMAENLPVYKLLYKPNRMPFFTFRLAGLIATLAFVFYSNWHQYVFHGLAGFYNYVADLYILQDNEALGQGFYDESRKYAFQNHRANYALATIKSSRLNFEGAHYNYELANGRRPSEFSLVNAGNLFAWEKKYFPAIQTYRQGKKIMPSSAALANNLGFAYAKIHALDSATYFISEGRNANLTRTSSEANFLAMAAMEYVPLRADSVVGIFNSNAPAVLANALALATLFGQPFEIPTDPLADMRLDLYSATLLNNYCVLHAKSIDTTFVHAAERTASDSVNAQYRQALKATLAHAYYHQGNVTRALELLAELAYLDEDYRGKYNYIMGLWALEQGSAAIASSYFMHAETADYKDARFYNAIALTEAGKINAATVAWDSVAKKGDENEKQIAMTMNRILSLSPAQAMPLPDPEKYQYCRYSIGLSDTLSFNRIANSFRNDNYKAQALLDRAERQHKAGNLVSATRYLNEINGLQLSDRDLFNNVRYASLRLLASRMEVPLLEKQMTGLTFDDAHQLEKMLYTALISDANGEHAKARQYFSIVGTWNPYFEEGVLAAADFFRKEDKDKMKAYEILVEAIQVNADSYRLLTAYAREAERMGFSEYAASARERLMAIKAGTARQR
ncbi:MAG TPA: hypothetical protein VF490_22200 [Chryseosolibacter sp.]